MQVGEMRSIRNGLKDAYLATTRPEPRNARILQVRTQVDGMFDEDLSAAGTPMACNM